MVRVLPSWHTQQDPGCKRLEDYLFQRWALPCQQMSASSPGPPSPPAFSSLCFLLVVASQRPWSHCGLWSLSGSTSGQPSAVNGAKGRGCHLCTFTECCLRLCSSWILCYVALSTTEVFIIVLISQVRQWDPREVK